MERKVDFVIIFLVIGFVSTLQAQFYGKIKHYDESDGYKFTGGIAEVNTDSDGLVWIVHYTDITRYDGGEFFRIKSSNVDFQTFLRFYEKPNGEKLIIDISNRIFFIEGDTLRASLLNDTLVKLSQGKFCSDFYFDEDDRLHITIPNRGYYAIDTLGKISCPLRKVNLNIHGVACILRKGSLPFMVFEKDSNASKYSTRFFYLVDDKGKILNKVALEKNRTSYPSFITALSNGNFLFSSGRGHLIEFNKSGATEIIPYDGFNIIGLFVDKNGGLWVSTTNGIHYYPDGRVDSNKRKSVMDKTFSTIKAQDFQGGIWVSSVQNRLNRLQFPEYTFYSAKNLLSKTIITAMEVANDKIYYGAWGSKLYTLGLANHESDSILIPEGSNQQLLVDVKYDNVNKRLWVSQRGKLIYSDRERWNAHPLKLSTAGSKYYLRGISLDTSVTLSGYCNNQFFYMRDTVVEFISKTYPHKINSLLILNDSIFVGTMKGLYLETGDSIIALKKRFPLLKNNVRIGAYFDGQVWVSVVGSGTYVFEKDTLVPVTVNGQKAALGHYIHEADDFLWLLNDRGSFKFSKRKDKNNEWYNGTVFSPPPYLWSLGSVYKDSSLYFDSSKEIMKVDFQDIGKSTFITPLLSITEFKVNDISRKALGSIHHLKSDENFIEILYRGINYLEPDVNYRYRVLGLKDSWSATKESSLRFWGLPSGDYTFEVQARISYQPWSKSRFVRFAIAPPYWKTWWFILCGCAITGFMLYQIANYRIQVANRQKILTIERLTAEQKALRAKMDPHFIFNVVASLQYLVRSGNTIKASQFLEKFGLIMRDTLDQTNIETISIKREQSFLRDYLDMERMRLEEKFKYSIEVESGINPDAAIPNFLIQPFVENAIQHGLKNNPEKGLLTVQFCREGQFLKVIVEDNGVGYNRTIQAKAKRIRSHEPHGVVTVRERLKIHNENRDIEPIVIEDLGNPETGTTGTRVSLLIKLKG